jgi:4-hydroxy-2-oxoheptanedioate aldolase
VREAERYVIETALKLGIAPRAEIARPEEAKRYLDMGIKHFCIGTDVSILFEWFVNSGKAMRSILGRDTDESAEPQAQKGYVSGAAVK